MPSAREKVAWWLVSTLLAIILWLLYWGGKVFWALTFWG